MSNMKNEEIKILANMAFLLPKIEIKDFYNEDDYYNIYQLIDGYKNLEKYFENNDEINEILNQNIDQYKLIDLIRVVRNRVAHIDKNNANEQLVLLQVKVNKKVIHKLINEIKIEMNNIYKNDLKNDSYKFIMNTRVMSYIFSIINYSINIKEKQNEFDEYCSDELRKILNEFDQENSKFEDFENVNKKIIDLYKSDKVKDGIIEMYNEQIYNDLLKMIIEEDSFTDSEIIELMNKIKNIKSSS